MSLDINRRGPRGNGMRIGRADIGYQIGRQVGIEGVHRHLVGGISTKADKAIRPHKDRPTVRNTGCSRIESRG